MLSFTNLIKQGSLLSALNEHKNLFPEKGYQNYFQLLENDLNNLISNDNHVSETNQLVIAVNQAIELIQSIKSQYNRMNKHRKIGQDIADNIDHILNILMELNCYQANKNPDFSIYENILDFNLKIFMKIYAKIKSIKVDTNDSTFKNILHNVIVKLETNGLYLTQKLKEELSHQQLDGTKIIDTQNNGYLIPDPDKPNKYFLANSLDFLGHGSHAYVYSFNNKIKISKHSLFVMPTTHKKALRIETNKDEHLIKQKNNTARIFLFSGTKDVFFHFDQAFTVMKKLGDQSLLYFLEIYGKNLDASQRNNLCYLVINTFKEQIMDINMIHGDVKPSNMLVAINHDIVTNVYHVDYDYSRHKDSTIDSYRGTRIYSAMELFIDRKNAGQSSDIYSLGICLLEILIAGDKKIKEKLDQINDKIIDLKRPYGIKKDKIDALFKEKHQAIIAILDQLKESYENYPDILELIQKSTSNIIAERPKIEEMMAAFPQNQTKKCFEPC